MYNGCASTRNFGLLMLLMKCEIMISRIANIVILPAVEAQFNSDLIPEWKHIIHMDGFTRLRVLDDVVPPPLIFIPITHHCECLFIKRLLRGYKPNLSAMTLK